MSSSKYPTLLIAGTIDQDGNILNYYTLPNLNIGNEAPFGSDSLGRGIYEITFIPRVYDDVPPVVTVSQLDNTFADNADTTDNAIVLDSSVGKIRVKTGKNTGDGENRSFCFTAIGGSSRLVK
jgi:hypothetical protein